MATPFYKGTKKCSKKFVATLKGNSLPEEMFLEFFFFFNLGRFYRKGVAIQVTLNCDIKCLRGMLGSKIGSQTGHFGPQSLVYGFSSCP